MTFKPTDDVIDEKNSAQEVLQNFSEGGDDGGHQIFHSIENSQEGNVEVQQPSGLNLDNAVIESSNTTDFSSLLKTEEPETQVDNTAQLGEVQSGEGEEQRIIFSNTEESIDSTDNSDEQNIQETEDLSSEDKLTDDKRVEIVSHLEGVVHSNLDLLVDKNRENIVNQYKIVNRVVFRWGSFIFVAILGLVMGFVFQTNASQNGLQSLITDSTIGDIWEEKTTKSVLNSVEGVETLVPYGEAEIKGKLLNSKSNLIKYHGLVLPQSISFRFGEEFISLQAFADKQTTRADLENLLRILIQGNSSLETKTEFVQSIQGGLEQGFHLGCLDTAKISDVVCDKFVKSFYEYGKYYNLVSYDSELLNITKKLKNQKRTIEPICRMVTEFTQRSSKSSSILESVMEYCDPQELSYYKKLVNFINLDQSLVSMNENVYSDPDLNAYKLVSLWQMLEAKNNIDKSSIERYLKYLQGVLDKDMGQNKYLSQIYKDLAYVYNMDYLYTPLQLNEKGSISTNDSKSLLLQINQINNGSVLGSVGLKTQLTTPDVIQTGFVVHESSIYRTAEELFAPYYSKVERLQIRKVQPISDEELRVQTEIYSMSVLNATNGETLKATINLKSHNRVLYVEKITIAQYSDFSKMLNDYVASEEVPFSDILVYIDEMSRFLVKDEEAPQTTLCDVFAGTGIAEGLDLYDCNESGLILYKGDIEYSFILNNWILDDFTISDEELENGVKEKLKGVMTTKANTESLIKSIVNYEIGETPDLDLVENEMKLIDQFRINFGRIPEVEAIEGETEIFVVKFELGDFKLQARYNINTRLLTRVSYVIGEETLEIRGLTIELTAQNDQISSIINNPRLFLSTSNPSAWKKYQKMLNGE